MENQIPKFNIEENNQELKLYFFTVQGGPVQIELPEDFKAVMAYNDQGALDQVRKDYPAGVIISVKKRAQIEVSKIVDVVNWTPSIVDLLPLPPELKFSVTPTPTKEKTIQDFIYGMMLIADKFVENKRDQASLKRIINKIKIHEDTPALTSEGNVT